MKKVNPYLISANRRKFIKLLSGGWATTMAYPLMGGISSNNSLPEAPALRGYKGVPDERYWEAVKKQFAVPNDKIMVNAANLCPSPAGIGNQILTSLRSLEKDVSFQNRTQFEEKRKLALELLASYLKVSKEEIGITRNTSEGNNIIVNGLDLKPGDEVITWEQNHPTNGTAWEQRAKRYGFTVKKIAVPDQPASIKELVIPFAEAITPKTKIITFSHISNSSGLALPARDICLLARSKNILTLVDGAQSFGSMDLDLKDMGCDFYTGSTHKWLMGPVESGVLYVNKAQMEKVWPNIISAGWKETYKTVDEKYCVLGQHNDLTVSAIPAILEFHEKIGKQLIQNRVQQLGSYLKEQLKAKVPNTVMVTPALPEASGGIMVFTLPNLNNAEIYQKLYSHYGIAGAPTGGIRLSPHIYNTKQDIDKIISALVTLAA
ncbi:aminotransferase class V-fold PLP-dependent enzyme [Adhaeribacter aquaticus]|uniref:aminotransferase class V-fold PLP-dependent enzyme n=1 Tax=Adhaeribacter aquaticus TaxID=299567 RepID=UPI00047AF69B|nr:aminotransferase class V-fold PLP-dependent enzyme [Adhaeribacter aquaticus]